MTDGNLTSRWRAWMGAKLLQPGATTIALTVISTVIVATAMIGAPDAGILPVFLSIPVILWLRGHRLRDIGLKRPLSWPRLLGTGLLIGLAAQLASLLLVNPLIEQFTRAPIDLSAFDSIRGNLKALLTLLAIVWAAAVFIEEIVFRGFLMTELKRLLGTSPAGLIVNLLLASTLFGLAHWYQGLSGMIVTGLIGLLLGYLFIRQNFNLWLPILVHGFLNTAGLIFIYLDADRYLDRL